MKILINKEEQVAISFFRKAALIASKSSCLRAKGGSVIVKNGEIIGKGFNSPPLDRKVRRCIKNDLPKDFLSDKTCCMHAEQRAIIDALKRNPSKIKNSRIYYIRLDRNDNIEKAQKPYCTICSKLSLDVGIKEFALWHDQGITIYNTQEYNDLTFKHRP